MGNIDGLAEKFLLAQLLLTHFRYWACSPGFKKISVGLRTR